MSYGHNIVGNETYKPAPFVGVIREYPGRKSPNVIGSLIGLVAFVMVLGTIIVGIS